MQAIVACMWLVSGQLNAGNELCRFLLAMQPAFLLQLGQVFKIAAL
jgi:hypothetical protein